MSTHVTIIAEAGVNHNGNLDTALKMIEAAAISGADYIKFQTFITEKLVTRNAPKAVYQEIQTGNEGSQFGMLKKLELNEQAHVLLKNHAGKFGIRMISTPFDEESAAMLNRLNVDLFKVGSGDLTNILLLRQLAKFSRPVILSTGMCDMDEIAKAIEILEKAGLGLFTVRAHNHAIIVAFPPPSSFGRSACGYRWPMRFCASSRIQAP